MMRISFVNHRDIDHPRAGGAERWIHDLGRALIKRGNSVEVVSVGWKGARSRQIVDGIRIRRFPGNLIAHAAVPPSLRLVTRPDVIVESLAHVVPWAGPRILRDRGVALFFHSHARTLRGQVSPRFAEILERIERMYPWIYRGWLFVTGSSQSADDLRNLGVPETDIRVIRPGVDTGVFAPGIPAREPRLVYFSGLREYKRPSHAIELLRRLTADGIDASLDIIGDGPSLRQVRANSSDLGSRVRFVGRIADARQLAELVGKAWLNVVTSTAEGWGLVILEAAACGVPTVGYRVPGVEEAVAAGETGLLAENGSVSELTSAAKEILKNSDHWRSRCRAYAESLTWESAAASWDSVLREAVG